MNEFLKQICEDHKFDACNVNYFSGRHDRKERRFVAWVHWCLGTEGHAVARGEGETVELAMQDAITNASATRSNAMEAEQ